MKFGFVAHPTSVPLKRHVKLVDTLVRHVQCSRLYPSSRLFVVRSDSGRSRRSARRVLRIHPPLALTRAEAERFVAAFKAVCADMATFAD